MPCVSVRMTSAGGSATTLNAQIAQALGAVGATSLASIGRKSSVSLSHETGKRHRFNLYVYLDWCTPSRVQLYCWCSTPHRSDGFKRSDRNKNNNVTSSTRLNVWIRIVGSVSNVPVDGTFYVYSVSYKRESSENHLIQYLSSAYV
jgi:hypothetical protein